MNYFICEGNEGNSDYAFCHKVVETVCVNEPYTLVSSHGNRGIRPTFDEMSSRFKAGDLFVLMFDCVATVDGVDTSDLLDVLGYKCSELGVRFKFTTYYCFEELFVTYTGLIDMLRLRTEKLSEEQLYLITYIQQSILNGEDYFVSLHTKIKELLLPSNELAMKNREKCSKALCNLYTTKLPNTFIISSHIGDCWILDCNCVRNHRNCSKCTYCCRNSTFKQKLADLEQNSVSVLSNPFSEIMS